MRRNIFRSVTQILTCIAVISVIIGTCTLASCQKIVADLVVYGKIFTAEENRIVEAFAVKDGKYIYVGDKKGAKSFIERGKTEVIDYNGKGLVMPSCGNGHAHYLSAYAIESFGTIIDMEDSVDKFLAEIVPAAVKKAKSTGAKAVYGTGWNTMEFLKNMPTRQQLDAICSDIPMYFSDEEGHKAIANTILMVKAGIMDKNGKVLKSEVRGGEIVMDSDGNPTGYLKEQAQNYVRSFLDNESLYSVDMAKADLKKSRKHCWKKVTRCIWTDSPVIFLTTPITEPPNSLTMLAR